MVLWEEVGKSLETLAEFIAILKKKKQVIQ